MPGEKDPPAACEHCGALVYADTKRCPQCHHFPVKLHLCPVCRNIGRAQDLYCSQCGRMYQPDGDYL